MEENARAKEEHALVMAFVAPSKRKRIAGFLRSAKNRTKFIAQLPHFSDFDPRFAKRIDSSRQDAASILHLLQSKGAGSTCYVLSVSGKIDQTDGALERVLMDVVGYEPGTIVSCVPGRLAYYEGEDRGERYLLAR